jgi:hypothetical protein
MRWWLIKKLLGREDSERVGCALQGYADLMWDAQRQMLETCNAQVAKDGEADKADWELLQWYKAEAPAYEALYNKARQTWREAR